MDGHTEEKATSGRADGQGKNRETVSDPTTVTPPGQVQPGWFRTPNWLARYQRGIPDAAFRTLIALLSFADAEGRAWPSYQAIARCTGLCRRSTIRAVNWLVQTGWIMKLRERDSAGGQRVIFQTTPGFWGGDVGVTSDVGVTRGVTSVSPIKRPEKNTIEQDSIYCSEPSKKASEPQPSEKAVMVFSCVGTGSSEWALTDRKLREYQEAYPGIDVLAECRRARQWLIDNPPRRKTAKGMPRFLNSWLSRAQDRAGRNAQPAAKPKPKKDYLPYLDDAVLRSAVGRTPK